MSDNSQIKERLKNLTPEQIRKLMSRSSGSATDDAHRMVRNDEGVYPLSRTQERIWFLSHLYPDSSLYNIPLAIRLRPGSMDTDRLTEVINRLVRENEILRTSFDERDGRVVQLVHDSLDIRIEYEDISLEEPDADTGQIIDHIGEAHGRTLFDLSKLPLFTVKLVKTGKDDYVLFFNLHHLISDGWTNSLLARDSALFYHDAAGRLPVKEKHQYIDYVKWEQQWLASPRYKKQLNYWTNELADLPEPFRFPRDFYTDDHSFGGRNESCSIPSRLHEKVSIWCQKQDVTPYQFYISCYALLLSRYSGKRDMVIGTPVANRNQRHFQNTYGVFINSLPLRFRVDTGQSFNHLLDTFKMMIRQSMNNQEVPFSEIINAVNPQRKLHDNPLYNVHFSYQHFPQKSREDEHALLPIDYRISKFDVNFWIKIAGDERTISVSYKNKLISKQKIDRFMEHYLLLAAAVIDRPDVVFRDLDYVPLADQSVLAGEKVEYRETSWLTLFKEAAVQFSDETAFVDELGKLTYRELNAHASALAMTLDDKGIKKGDVVMIRTGRNRNFVISILACMKCGAAYLPVDNRIASERFGHIIQESGACIVLTETDIENVDCLGFEGIAGPEVEDGDFEDVETVGEDIAYIIYTSGSTGRPKGVCVPHRALLNYTYAMRSRIGDPGVRSFAHVSAFDADLGNTSLFLALGFGGTLVVPGAEALLDPDLLTSFFSKYPIDALKIVPSHLSALSENLSGILPRKLLITGGELLSGSLVSEVRKASPLLRVINHYGPAEATIGSLTYEVPADSGEKFLPIGHPIDNSSVVLVDSDMQSVPKGVPGEICLTGANISLYYLNQPELSAERFIHDPSLGTGPVYRTGDRGYLNELGQVVFLDRADRQVKVNGFRIEPGEIEAVLKFHPSVINAFVFITTGDNEQRKLDAAVQVNGLTDARDLKVYLAKYFPQVLIPTIYIVDDMPVTRNGKIDGEGVENLCAHLGAIRTDILPRDIIELRLTEIFRSILNVAVVNPDDQFFDLGGHSLLAIRMISHINKAFQTRFQIAILFEYGSVKELASLIRKEGMEGAGDPSPYVTLIETRQDTTFIWIHPAGGNVMSYYPVANALSASYGSAAFTATDHHLQTDLSITGLSADYAAELETRRETAGIVLAGWSMGALIAHEIACRLADKGEKRPLIIADQPVPHYGSGPSQTYEERLVSYIEKVGVFTGEHIRMYGTTGIELDYEILYREFIRLGLMPNEVTMGGFRIFLDILVKHNNIISDFYPSVYKGPALLLKASEKIMLKTSNPQPEYFLHDLGWGAFCTDLTIMEVPGNHITMMSGKHAHVTAKHMQDWITGL